ncbi:hypothetical protein BB559_003727 [Furculomyces boomerangus]|uniref:Sm domain-containing protein n=2 Tax=Harpellales TaxID=61421 RepID=A0A2T9YJG7_9FUNG|nr:hypothetical protein BB559_003727 [Furculomyces boomerangus]PVZ98275.1 hypothetical protein BB558_005725 [Smittium angustum]PVZ99931.1 hypothetical protein BB558_004030 [Smittium angustum]
MNGSNQRSTRGSTGRGGGQRGRGGNQGHNRGKQGTETKKVRQIVFDLNKYIDKMICVKFLGGREVTGLLKGFDQLQNMVLDDSVEQTRDSENFEFANGTTRNLGLLVCRGPSVIAISPLDGSEEIENPFLQTDE